MAFIGESRRSTNCPLGVECIPLERQSGRRDLPITTPAPGIRSSGFDGTKQTPRGETLLRPALAAWQLGPSAQVRGV